MSSQDGSGTGRRRYPVIDFHVHPSISKSFDRQREALERILHEAHSYGVDKVVLSGLTDLGPSVTPDDSCTYRHKPPTWINEVERGQ